MRQERVRPWEIGSEVDSEFGFDNTHGVIRLNAVPASRKAALSQILCREMSSLKDRSSSEEDRS